MSAPKQTSTASEVSKQQIIPKVYADDSTNPSSELSGDSNLSDMNNDDITSTPDTQPDDSADNEDFTDITPTEPKLLEDGRYDILTTHPMKIIKRIITEGEGLTPPFEADCNVLYKGKLQDGTVFDKKLDKKEPFNFTIGSHSVIKGWEIAVLTMKKHEKAEFTIAPEYAYGEKGSSPSIPPNATLIFEIELLNFYKDPVSVEERIAYSELMKECGTKHVQKGEWELAFRCYRKAQGNVNDLYHRKLNLRERLKPLKIALHLNTALCSLKVKSPQLRRAVHETSWVLLISPHHPKALYRRGLAYTQMQEYEKAHEDLTEAAKLQPKDALIRQALIQAKSALQRKEAKEKKMFAGMFERMKEEDGLNQEKIKNEEKEKKRREKEERRERKKKEKEEKKLLKEKIKELNLAEIEAAQRLREKNEIENLAKENKQKTFSTSSSSSSSSSISQSSDSNNNNNNNNNNKAEEDKTPNSQKSRFQSVLMPSSSSTPPFSPSPSPSPSFHTLPDPAQASGGTNEGKSKEKKGEGEEITTHFNGYTHTHTHVMPRTHPHSKQKREKEKEEREREREERKKGTGESGAEAEVEDENGDSSDFYMGDEQTESEESSSSS